MKNTVILIIIGALLAGRATPASGPPAPPTEGTLAPAPTTAPPTVVPTAVPTDTPISTRTASATPKPTDTPTPTPSPIAAPLPTATPVPQTLGRIFPEGYDSPGVWSNTNTGRDIVAMDFDIHFDVGLPSNLVLGQDPVLFPASGRVVKVYTPGPDMGQCIVIEPVPALAGIDHMLSSAGLDRLAVDQVRYHLAHITPWRAEGRVEAGEPAGTVVDGWYDPDKVALMIIVKLQDGREYQFSPCTLPNTTSFCGKCYPGTPYNCP
jgi:hypothetical protein